MINKNTPFKDRELIINENNILLKDEPHIHVMMDWEKPLMKKHADIVCQNGGDILEIGFGMGISADYIQSHNINSHTIVEIHPQILEKLKKWSEGKKNVNIIHGDWYENLYNLGKKKYDGIFLDSFYDKNIYYAQYLIGALKPDGIFSIFSPHGRNLFPKYDDMFYREKIENIKIENNEYHNEEDVYCCWIKP